MKKCNPVCSNDNTDGTNLDQAKFRSCFKRLTQQKHCDEEGDGRNKHPVPYNRDCVNFNKLAQNPSESVDKDYEVKQDVVFVFREHFVKIEKALQ